MRRLLLACATLALLSAPGALAQSAIMGLEPPSITVKVGKKDGTLLDTSDTLGVDTLITPLNNSEKDRITFIARNIPAGDLMRIIALNNDTQEEAVLAEQVNKKTKRQFTIRSNGAQPLPDGNYTIILSLTTPGEPEERTTALFMTIDTVPPGPAPAPDLLPTFDTGLQSIDNLTSLDSFEIVGNAEPGSTVFVAVDGKVKRKGKQASFDIVPATGQYRLLVRKARKGTHDYAVVQVDAAGNESAVGAPLTITVDTKAPRPLRDLEVVPADIKQAQKGFVTVSTTRPAFTGRGGEPGNQFTIIIDGKVAASSFVAPDGSITSGPLPFINRLSDGFHTVTAVQRDRAGNESKPAKPISIFVEPGTGGGEPPMDAVLVDQFDGVRNPAFQWTSGARDSALLSVAENPATDRLEFTFAELEGDNASAAFVSDGWGFDLTKGFRFRVDWIFRSKLQVAGEHGLRIALAADASTTSGDLFEGVEAVIGRDDSGEIVAFRRLADGQTVEDDATTVSRAVDIGAVYFDYDATSDTLKLSISRFDDPNAFVIENLRSKLGTDRAALLLGAFADGFTPAIAANDALLDNLVVEEGLLNTNVELLSSGFGLIPTKSDDFNDNALSSDWLSFTTDAAVVSPAEANSRLEIAVSQNNQSGAGATEIGGVTGSDWAIDLNSDARLRIDWRFDAPETEFGDVRLGVGLAQAFDPATGDISEGVLFVFRQSDQGAQEGVVVKRSGAEQSSTLTMRERARGTLYLTWEAAANRLKISMDGFSDDSPTIVSNVRTASLTTARLVLFAESQQLSPAVTGPDAYFDNFFLDVGTLTAPPPPPGSSLTGGPPALSAPAFAGAAAPSAGEINASPCPFDLNSDGVVNAADLEALLARSSPPPTSAEIQALLNSFGPCPG